MVLAFGAMEPLAVAAAALSRGVLVAAAGVVVVLAILLVFVMVLRGAGSSRQKASGLDYDAQQGPVGQPRPSANEPAPAAWPTSQADGRFDAMDHGFDQGYGQGRPAAPQAQAQQAQGWGQPFGEPAQAANAASWGAPAGGQMGGASDWGTPQPQSRPAATPWDAPAGQQQWGNPAAPASRPGGMGGMNGMGANGAGPANPNAWDAPAPAWDAAPAAPSQPSWGGQPAAPSQPAWGAPAAAPSQPSWGGQPAAPSQPAWGAQPAAPSQPAWGAQPDPSMMAPTMQRGATGYDVPRLIERKNDGSGREFDLRKDRLTIGRHRESDVFLEDLAVSRLHTTISRDGSGRYILRDENSANGTYVNGQRVSEQLLKDGDEVQVGQTVLVFQQH